MPYLVDGNNVMGQTPGWHRDKPGARRRLLGELAAFAAATRARITVVFDGAPEADVPDGCVFKGVRVYYPPRGGDADSIIERLVVAARDRRGITVVTSDRQLALDCRSSGAQVMRSGDFRKTMAASGAGKGSGDPGAHEQPSTGPLADWLEYFGVDDIDER
jgi:predicted RNA-binding protein with PIN domain